MYRYFKREWKESREDELDSWGSSFWYFEIGPDGYPHKQMELYENGNRLKYHSKKPFDDYGGLGDQALDLEAFQDFEIEQEEFYAEWNKSNPKKEHQEILDLIANYLANHYSQRFGQALFNLGINEFADKTNPEKENYRMRDIHNDSDSAILERIKARKWFKLFDSSGLKKLVGSDKADFERHSLCYGLRNS